MDYPHIPILVEEILSFFKGCHLKYFVDGTLGAAGHAEAILKEHPEIERFIGIDQDDLSFEIAKKRLKPWEHKVSLAKGNFEDLDKILKKHNILAADGMLFDLGVSSMQLDLAEKGFSFMRDGPLDMRMDKDSQLTAEKIVNEWDEKEIGRVLREYGEEKQWRKAASAIVQARKKAPITTTLQLKELLSPLFSWKKKGINPLTLIFQGLRIAVNRELDVLEVMIPKSLELLQKGGRLGVITFHSLEDRIVKNAFRFAASDKFDTVGLGGVFKDKEPLVKILTKKPLAAAEEEITKNPRSRSAKLRFIEKL
ncbi:MAG TPA: 16S rRNA (cytosine(1402)-N(4))-methyltransferase RsmH [Parachlamydiaceae bacterium]|nr:16S rRNA (cytosine(1402)-N(4))-methyltransferase RsmH [Parachlamydiaceae bacterium]